MRKGETLADRQAKLDWLRGVADESGEGCREWPWARSEKGYGNVRWDGRSTRVGHVVLTLSGRPRPFPGAQQLHACDNPSCCAPWHLRWGTNRENRREAVERGRHFSKLSEADVETIYAAEGRQRDIAAKYGVTQRVVWQIKNGKTWARVTGHAA